MFLFKSSLYKASFNNNLEKVKRLLSKGSSQKDKNESLLIACRYGYLEVIRLLLEYGADIHYNDDEALADAVGHNCFDNVFINIDVVKLLLEYGADIHAKDYTIFAWVDCYNHEHPVTSYLANLLLIEKINSFK